MDAVLRRSKAYLAAGADALFPEALTQLSQYKAITDAFPGVPVLANMTEFGKTELFSKDQLNEVGVGVILYPVTAFRMAAAASLDVYRTILQEGSQKSCVPKMQTREELYKFLDYHKYEQELDKLFGQAPPPAAGK